MQIGSTVRYMHREYFGNGFMDTPYYGTVTKLTCRHAQVRFLSRGSGKPHGFVPLYELEELEGSPEEHERRYSA